jgi:hypothetical protein
MKRVRRPVRCLMFSVHTIQVVTRLVKRLNTLMVSCSAGDFSLFSKALCRKSPGVICMKNLLSYIVICSASVLGSASSSKASYKHTHPWHEITHVGGRGDR